MTKGKLFLLDGMALIYRAFFAFSQNPRMTSKGFNASAMFGFTNTLLEIIRKQKPTHIAVVFDTPAPTKRHIQYTAYKAQREAMPEDLRLSIPFIFRIVEGFNIPVIAMDGYEADDIIGTLAWKAGDLGYDVFMMTPDKDFGQLVRENVKIFKPGRMGNDDEILGIQEVLSKWEISDPKQVIDILGLWGDASDNIPGVPGVGEKTAKKLIQEFGSMEVILENTHQLKGKLQENLIAFAEQAKMSKWLATIDTAVPLELDIENFSLKPLDETLLRNVFDELEFRNMLRRAMSEAAAAHSMPIPRPASSAPVPGLESPRVENNEDKNAHAPMGFDLFGQPISTAVKKQSRNAKIASVDQAKPLNIFEESYPEDNDETLPPLKYKTLADVDHQYRIAENTSQRAKLLAELQAAEAFCFDTETTGIESMQASLVGLSFSTKAFTGWYVPIPITRDEAALILDEFRDIFASPKRKIAQNIKYDISVLRNYSVAIAPPFFDTMLAHYLLEPDQRHNMQWMSEKFLGYTPISIETLIGKKGKNQGNMKDVPLAQIAEYASEDADITIQLYGILRDAISERGLDKLLYEVEMPLVTVLEEMEREGVKIDVAFLQDYSKELLTQVRMVQSTIFGLAGNTFNIASAQQVGNILFEQLKLLEKPKKTKTGQYQTDEESLNSILDKHPIVQQILDFRTLQKLKSTYVDALPLLVSEKTGRIHTHFNQAVAATGRLSSQNPNLQNIPIRTELGREIRKAFVPQGTEKQLLSCDYSQIELRIIAHISADKAMQEAFHQGIDIHIATASKVWDVPVDQVDKEMRRKAKTVNFGIIYGISAFGLSQRVGISRTEAKEIIQQYFIQFGGIKDYMDETVLKAKEMGYVETILGRRRYMRDINSVNAVMRGFAERNAINAPIQGSAADMIKLAMIHIQDWLKAEKCKTRMLLQVHDELLFEVPREELLWVEPKIKSLMENALPLNIPVLVESGIGSNWLEAH
ncbi:MAG: DNA polymerase I [Flavobacteriaceae bacterium]|nr:DNA polymerase I [Flavobacteriaceae bacterium]